MARGGAGCTTHCFGIDTRGGGSIKDNRYPAPIPLTFKNLVEVMKTQSGSRGKVLRKIERLIQFRWNYKEVSHAKTLPRQYLMGQKVSTLFKMGASTVALWMASSVLQGRAPR